MSFLRQGADSQPSSAMDPRSSKDIPFRHTHSAHTAPSSAVDKAAFAPGPSNHSARPGPSSSHRKPSSAARPTKPRRAPKIARPQWAVPPRVLLVEDDVVYRMLSGKLLEVFGCMIDIAVDGAAAVHKMNLEKYDLVFMDVMMPNLDGVSATMLIRKFDHLTPIISVTSNSHPEEVVSYYSSGMNDVLPKPFTRDGVFGILEKHLVHLKPRRSNEASSSSMPSTPPSSPVILPEPLPLVPPRLDDESRSTTTPTNHKRQSSHAHISGLGECSSTNSSTYTLASFASSSEIDLESEASTRVSSSPSSIRSTKRARAEDEGEDDYSDSETKRMRCGLSPSPTLSLPLPFPPSSSPSSSSSSLSPAPLPPLANFPSTINTITTTTTISSPLLTSSSSSSPLPSTSRSGQPTLSPVPPSSHNR